MLHTFWGADIYIWRPLALCLSIVLYCHAPSSRIKYSENQIYWIRLLLRWGKLYRSSWWSAFSLSSFLIWGEHIPTVPSLTIALAWSSYNPCCICSFSRFVVPRQKKLKVMYIGCILWVQIHSENPGIFLTHLPLQYLRSCKNICLIIYFFTIVQKNAAVCWKILCHILLYIAWLVSSLGYQISICYCTYDPVLFSFIYLRLRAYALNNWFHTDKLYSLIIFFFLIQDFFSHQPYRFGAAGMKMLLTDSLMRSTLLLHMNGGKGQSIAYFQSLHILVPGPGNNGVGEKKFIGFRSLWSLNTTILVYALADLVLYTKEWRLAVIWLPCCLSLG